MKHYPALPHGKIEAVFEGIFFVKGTVKMPMMLPMKISRSMTIVRILGTDELVLINSMRLTEKGLSELASLGKVAHVIRLGGFHGRDDAFYRERFGAKIHALEGHFYSRSMDVKKKGAIYMEPDERLGADAELPLPGASLITINSSPPEGILRLPDHGGVLVTSDSLQNTPSPDEFVNLPAKIIMKKMGFYHPHLVGPAWLKYAKPSADEVRALLKVDFEHVLPGHGDPVIGEGKEKYLPSINSSLKNSHA